LPVRLDPFARPLAQLRTRYLREPDPRQCSGVQILLATVASCDDEGFEHVIVRVQKYLLDAR